MNAFVTAPIIHLESIESLNFIDLLNVSAFHYSVFKGDVIISPPILSEKNFNYWDGVMLMVVNTKVFKILIFA